METIVVLIHRFRCHGQHLLHPGFPKIFHTAAVINNRLICHLLATNLDEQSRPHVGATRRAAHSYFFSLYNVIFSTGSCIVCSVRNVTGQNELPRVFR